MKIFDTIIVGAGASGMTAALACGQKGQKVLLIDKLSQMGKKILATGNGKCNLTNQKQQPEFYRSENGERVQAALCQFGFKETMELFHDLGIFTREQNGYIYPYSEQASCVREAFETTILSREEITFWPETEVWHAEAPGLGFSICDRGKNTHNRFLLQTTRGKVEGRSLIVATGGLAGPSFGCSGDGYRLAEELGHRIIPPFPALTALTSSAPFLKKIKGVRTKAQISLYLGEEKAGEEKGELQWTDYGISGVAVFSLSRFAVDALRKGQTVRLMIDFLPEYTKEETVRLLKKVQKKHPDRTALSFAQGFFPAKLSPVILREAKIMPEEKIGNMSENKSEELIKAMKNFVLRINGYKEYDKAQVTAGGVPLSGLTDQMESRFHPGLFFTGELTDVDGICGGYNLQWAFSTGTLAGRAALERNLSV